MTRKRLLIIPGLALMAALLGSVPSAQADPPDAPPGREAPDLHDRVERGDVTEVVWSDPAGNIHKTTVPNAAALEGLEHNPNVVTLQANETFTASQVEELNAEQMAELDPAGTNDNNGSGSATLTAQGFTGSGTAVAILDTGFDTAVSGISGKVLEEACISGGGYCGATWLTGSATVYDASNPYVGSGAAANYPSSCSGYSHGTYTATTAAGSTAAGSATGAAQDAVLVLVRIASCGGTTDTFNIANAIAYVNNRASTYAGWGFQLVGFNVSFSSDPPGPPTATECDASQTTLKPVIDQARTNGFVTVIAAGNGSSSTAAGSPACISTSLSVGGYNGYSGNAAVFDWAPWVDTVTGAWLVAAQAVGGSVIGASGTSLAAPQALGVIAQVRQAHPSTSGKQMHDAFRSAGPLLRDLRPGAPGYGLTLRQLWGPDVSTKAGELTSIVANKYNPIKPTRVVDTFGNFRGVGVLSGTDMTVNLADAMGVDPTQIGSVVAQVTMFGDACLSVLSPRPSGTTYTGAAGTISQSGIVSSRNLIIPNASGVVDFRMSGGCTAGPYQFNVEVVGFFGNTADLNEINPARVINGATLGANATGTYTVVGGASGIPTNATGIVGMLTVQQAGATSFQDIGPGGAALGGAAPMTSPAGVMRDNLVWTSLNGSGQVSVWNLSGTATLYLDVYGYTLAGSNSVVMLDPTRTYDSRGVGTVSTSVSRTTALQGVGGVPSSGIKATAVNIMGLDATGAPSYLNITNNAQAATGLVDVNLPVGGYVDNSDVVADLLSSGNLLKGQLVGGSAGTANVIVETMAYMPN